MQGSGYVEIDSRVGVMESCEKSKLVYRPWVNLMKELKNIFVTNLRRRWIVGQPSLPKDGGESTGARSPLSWEFCLGM